MRKFALKNTSDAFIALKELKQRSEAKLFGIEEQVKEIIANVKEFGDDALRNYSREFDGYSPENFLVSEDEIDDAYNSVGEEYIEILKTAHSNIKRYHSQQTFSPLAYGEDGIKVSQMAIPVSRAGIYVPGGIYPYPSTVLMCATPAACAGVKEIAMVTPVKLGGKIKPIILAAAKIAGVTEIYKIGGAQAIAALAYGTETIQPVDKICGPGNAYVTCAKRLVFGQVGIDMLAGPSELLVIADHRANPAYVAADMLAQSEHDQNSAAILLTCDAELASKVDDELNKQLLALAPDSPAHISIEANAVCFIADTLEECAKISNLIAPEHLEIATDDPESLLPLITNAGSIFLGDYTPEPLGDYIAGPNHTLPTSGTARFFSPLSTYDFMKRMSVLYYDKDSLAATKDQIADFARSEGLEAHARSVLRRFEN